MFKNAIDFEIIQQCNSIIYIKYHLEIHIENIIIFNDVTHYLETIEFNNNYYHCKYIDIKLEQPLSLYYYNSNKKLEYFNGISEEIYINNIINIKQYRDHRNYIFKYVHKDNILHRLKVSLNLDNANLSDIEKSSIELFSQINNISIISHRPFIIEKEIASNTTYNLFFPIKEEKNNINKYITIYNYPMDIMYHIMFKNYKIFTMEKNYTLSMFTHFIYNNNKYFIFKIIHDPKYSYIFTYCGIPKIKFTLLQTQQSYVNNHYINIVNNRICISMDIMQINQSMCYENI